MLLSRRRMLAAVGVAALAPRAGAQKATRQAAVTTPQGRLRGNVRDGVLEFLGVPFGADTRPVRFRPPMPHPGWTGVRPATGYGPAAPQAGSAERQSEDCLVLNVWTPGVDPHGKLPVLVYLHGGGYMSGSGRSVLTDGVHLARRGEAVVITLNHRLNLLGHTYLARALGDDYAASGNAGLLDIILALEWVRDCIPSFGGDPGCVTLFGQSGGGAKIATLMAMPAAKGLFHRAWTMSGQQVTAQGARGAGARARALAAHLNVAIKELPELQVENLLAGLDTRDPSLSSRIYCGPVLDGASLPVHPFWPEAPAQSADIPMVMGNTRHETGSLIARGDPTIFDLDWSTLADRLERDMVSDIPVGEAIAFYRALDPTLSPAQVFIAATTAGRSWRGQVIEAEARARQGAPTWVYQLDYPSRSEGGRLGAYHTLDIPLVFRTIADPGSDTGADASAVVASDAMSDALLRFARTGDPSGGDLGAWPQYDLANRATQVFNTESRVVNDPRGAERRFFARAPYIQPGTY